MTFILLNVYAQQPTFDWAKRIGNNTLDLGQHIRLDNFGNVYSVGYFQGVVDFDPSAVGVFNLTSNGTSSYYIQKLDASGNFMWAKKIDGINCTITSFDVDSNIYLVGHYQDSTDFDPSPTTSQYLTDTASYILKLNLLGDFIWVKSIKANHFSTIGLDGNSNLYLSGGFTDSVDFDPSFANSFFLSTSIVNGATLFFLKLNSDGDFIWAKKINSGSTFVNSIAVEELGNFVVTGNYNGNVDFNPSDSVAFNLTSSVSATYNCFTLKLNSNGNFMWANDINTFSYGYGASIDFLGNVLITGFYSETADFDPSLINTYNLTSDLTTNDIFVQKLDSSGNFIWAKSIGSNGDDQGYTISTDIVGSVYIGGIFGYTVDFDPSSGGTVSVVGNPNSSAGMFDGYILKLDAVGNFNWVQHIGGNGSTGVASLVMDSNVNVYSTGYFGGGVPTGSANFDESNSNFTLSSTGNNPDAFVYKLSQPTIVSVNPNKFQELSNFVFPNPTTGLVNLKGIDLKSNFILYDLLGNNIKIENINSNNQLDISDLNNGVYFLSNGNKNYKIVKE